MQKKIQRILKEHKGYTVLELLMVITVITILATITVVGIYGYLRSAYSLKANQTAKTVFYATQNYLVDQKEKGALDTFNKQAKKPSSGYGLSLKDDVEAMLKANGFSDEKIAAFDKNHKNSKFRYLYLDDVKVSDARKVTDKKSNDYNVLYAEILEPYIKDSNITDHSFLVEYDSTTGVVMSVFYSEKIDGFVDGKNPYDNQKEERYNTIIRDAESLSKKWQGYYGIYDTNQSEESVELTAPKVRLVNEQRLTLQWQDTNDTNSAFVKDPDLKKKLYFEIEITSVNRKPEDKPLSIKIAKIKADGGTPSSWNDEATIKDKEGVPIFIYHKDEKTGQGTYELLLDCFHHSILENYPEVLASDMLQCKITAKLEDMTTTKGEATSNKESANYGGGDAKTMYGDKEVSVGGSGNLLENGDRGKSAFGLGNKEDLSYTINNERHFNNIRNMTADKDFMQTGDVNWSNLEGKPNSLLFETFIFVKQVKANLKPGDYTEATFKGSYRVKDEKKINGLTIKSTSSQTGENVGIFAINGGEISGINLASSSITGVSKVGGVAGTNNAAGTIVDITADATVTGVYPDGSGSTVSDNYASNIGGVIGVNNGVAENLTTGQRLVSGRRNVGGVIGSNTSKEDAEGLANGNTINVLATAASGWGNFGGISGSNAEQSTLINCTNSGIVELNESPQYTTSNQPQYIGGIVGYNEGYVETCVNQGKKEDVDAKTDACLASLNRENSSLPEHYGVFVGGIAGGNIGKSATIRTSSLKNAYVTGRSIVGGIAGVNWEGTIHESDKKDSDVSGLIIGTESLVGGIVGYTDANISKFSNSANVFGDSLVGGITGFHGSKFKTLAELEDYDWYAIFEGLEEGTEEYYEALLECAEDDVIDDDANKQIKQCNNAGFVYARTRYSGGIAGVNWGRINNSYSNIDVENTKFIYEDNTFLRRADCAGGVVGLNDGVLKAESIVKTDSIVYGKSFSGGVVGCNLNEIAGYEVVAGSVFGSGNYVGGFIGLNTYDKVVNSKLEKMGKGTITGKDYVGGLIGCNVMRLKGIYKRADIKATTSADTEIIGQAYVGGIVGYHTIDKDADLESICSELYQRDTYEAFNLNEKIEEEEVFYETFMNCENRASVSGFRYVGGIIGLNEKNSWLTIEDSRNYGDLEIDTVRMAQEGVSVQPDKVAATDEESGTSYFIGGITGRNTPLGKILQCHSSGKVSSPSRYLGGLCEINEGTIELCTIGSEQQYASNVAGDNSVGGLVGLNHSITEKEARIVKCTANMYASISGGTNTGGLVGTNKAIVEGSTSYASVTSKGDNVGGIAGINEGTLTNIKLGPTNISGRNNVGGFVGNNKGVLETEGNIKDLTNHANVKGVNQVGGIVGIHNATEIINCKNYGTIEATGTGTAGCAGGVTGINGAGRTIRDSRNYGTVISKNSKAGGIVGWNQGTLSKNINEGSVRGSYQGNGEDAVGGITGTNARNAKVIDCVSNANAKKTNSINGGAMVGGIVGVNQGMVTATADEYKTVTIDIQITQKLLKSDNTENRAVTSYIGGIIGMDGVNETSRTDQKILEGYIFDGTIHVAETGSTQQCIGGIIGIIGRDYTVDQCEFTGKITGFGNTPRNVNDGGVGGITGTNSGEIILTRVTTSDSEKRYSVSKTAATKKSVVEGHTSIGGVVGNIKSIYNTISCKGKIPSSASNRITNYSTVSGNRYVGGIAGKIGTSQSYSYLYNQGTISGNTQVGGIFGIQSDTTAKAQYLFNEKAGKILAIVDSAGAASNIGGITGNSRFEMSNCENQGTLGEYQLDRTSQNIVNVGGIVGDGGTSLIENCHNSGNVYLGNRVVGGIVGLGTNITIKNCKNLESGVVDAAAINSGGIVGQLATSGYSGNKGQNFVQGCENDGKVILRQYNNIPDQDLIIGGIVGQVFGTDSSHMTTLDGCKNNGEVSIELTQDFLSKYKKIASAGGTIGYMWGRTIIENCENTETGIVDAGTSGKAGGIIGRFKTVKAPENGALNSISNNINRGTVIGQKDAGGIVSYHESFISLAFNDNWNKGTVKGNTFVGGLIGNLYNYTADENSGSIVGGGNKGTIQVESIGFNGTSEAASIGGCFGNSTCYGLSITGVKNEGIITFAPSITKVQSVGGIMGYGSGNVFEGCENNADLDLRSSKAEINYLGGIAGNLTLYANTKEGITKVPQLKDCSNSGSIQGDKTNKTGGIIGELSDGVIMSCSNVDATKVIEGKTRVGGIAGSVREINAKVMGVVTANGTKATYNEQTIKGDDILGGIVGEQYRSVLYSVYNAGDVQLTTNKNAAGGIVGISQKPEKEITVNTGLLINCYNFGNIGFTESMSGTTTGFLGGLVGFRETNKSAYGTGKWNINDTNICTSTTIKDSYHVKDTTEETKPIVQMNGQKLKSGKWAIGNEPFMKFQTENNDSQSSDPLQTGKFEWSEATFKNMLKAINWTEPQEWNTTDPQANVQFMLDHYVYKLPTPQGESVTGVEGYKYNMRWLSQVGLTSGIELGIYDKEYTVEELKTAKPLYAFEVSEQTTEGVDIKLPEEIAKDYMGKPLYIATKALGYSIEGIDVTIDSDKQIVQGFVVMPPLPAPTYTVEQTLGSLEVIITINNISAYLEKPNVKYPELGTREENGKYAKYENGAGKVRIIDYFRHSETDPEVSHKMKEYEITNIDWKKDTATIKIDYAAPENQIENRLYHTYRIQMMISEEDSKKSLKPSDNIQYRYLSSEKTEQKFKVKTDSLLEAPEELKYVYTGDLTEASYTLSWKNTKLNEGHTNGYEVVVKNPIKGKTKTIQVSGEGTTSCQLSKADVKELVDSFAYGSTEKTLTFTVKACSGDADIKDSLFSAPVELKVPQKQKTVEQFSLHIDEPIYKPDIVRIEWLDTVTEVLDTNYRVVLKINDQEASELNVEYVKETTDTFCEFTVPKDLLDAQDTTVEISVVKAGNVTSSFDSDPGVFSGTVYKRLNSVPSASAGDVSISVDDPNQVESEITWTKPAGATSENCSGYLIAVLPTSEVDMRKAETFFVEGADTTSTTLKFAVSNLGDDLFVYIYARGVDGKSSTSHFKQFANIKLPTERAPASTELKVVLLDADNNPVGETCDEATLQHMQYYLSWKNPENPEYTVKGHRLMLTDDNGKIIPLDETPGGSRFIDLSERTEQYTAQIDLTKYQGKTLKWSVINLPYDSGKLSSIPVEVTFVVPTVPVTPVQ